MQVDVVLGKADWDSALKQMVGFDFVHTHDFHEASQSNGEGEPIAFVAHRNGGQVQSVWPALRRNIAHSDRFDLTSVYGYAGPLFRANADSGAALTAIFSEMQRYGAVSLFSRMHPWFVRQINDESLRGQKLGDVVAIEVSPTADVLTGYRASHRREIINARRAGLSVTISSGSDALGEFSRIYRQSMAVLKASEYYYFSDSYFDRLLNAEAFQAHILFAELAGRNVAASIFVVTGTTMQYYLSGTDANFRKLSPSKAIIAKAHELALGLGVERIILGGGVGSTRDALFNFKAGFSDLFLPFYITKRVLDLPAYQRLCDERAVGLERRTAFFPAYRAQSS